MATITDIKLKRSATAGKIPLTTDLDLGEIAINTYDGKLYIKKDVGGTESIVLIGPGAASAGLALGDNDKATFGDSNDLEIYHDGSASFITNVGTGNLRIQGTNLALQNAAGTKNYLLGIDAGATTVYFDNAAKLATTATGIDVTGTATMDGLTVDGTTATIQDDSANLRFENSAGTRTGYIQNRADAFDIWDDQATPMIFGTSNAERMRIDSSGNVGIGTSSPSSKLDVVGTATISTDLNVGGAVKGNAGTRAISVGTAGSVIGGLQLWSTTVGTSYVQFGDEAGTAANHYRGYMSYNHSND